MQRAQVPKRHGVLPQVRQAPEAWPRMLLVCGLWWVVHWLWVRLC